LLSNVVVQNPSGHAEDTKEFKDLRNLAIKAARTRMNAALDRDVISRERQCIVEQRRARVEAAALETERLQRVREQEELDARARRKHDESLRTRRVQEEERKARLAEVALLLRVTENDLAELDNEEARHKLRTFRPDSAASVSPAQLASPVSPAQSTSHASSASPALPVASPSKTILTDELRRVEAEKAELEEALQASHEERDSLTKELDSLRGMIRPLQEAFVKTKSQRDEARIEADKLRKQLVQRRASSAPCPGPQAKRLGAPSRLHQEDVQAEDDKENAAGA